MHFSASHVAIYAASIALGLLGSTVSASPTWPIGFPVIGADPVAHMLPPDELFEHVNYASATYKNGEAVRRWVCGTTCRGNMKVEVVLDEQQSGGSGFIGVDDDAKRIVVAFRGTDNFRNDITNIQFAQVPYPNVPLPNAKVHDGFQKLYELLSNDVIDTTHRLITDRLGDSRYNFTDYRVVVTGHSLGGALATFGALDIKRRIFDKINLPVHQLHLTTIAQPRTGNNDFVQYVHNELNITDNALVNFNGSTYRPATFAEADDWGAERYTLSRERINRIVHDNDIVPGLLGIKDWYAHHGHEVWAYRTSASGQSFLNLLFNGLPRPPLACGSPNSIAEDKSCSASVSFKEIPPHYRLWGVEFNDKY